jgi:hypothetical protein
MGYGLASRAVSLVSIIQRVGDQAGVVPEQQVVAVGMPEGLEQGAYFGGGGILRGMSYGTPGVYCMTASIDGVGLSEFSASSVNVSCDSNDVDQVSLTNSGGTFSSSLTSSPVTETVVLTDGSGSKRRDLVDARKVSAKGRRKTRRTAPPQSLKASLQPRGNPRGDIITSGNSGPSDLLLMMLAALEADGGMPATEGFDRALHTVLVGLIVLNAETGRRHRDSIYGLHLKKMANFLAGQDSVKYAPIIEAFRNPMKHVEGQWSTWLAEASNPEAVRPETVWGEIFEALGG